MGILRFGGNKAASTYDAAGRHDTTNQAWCGTLLWQRSICHPGGLALGADVLFGEVLDPDPAVGFEHWAPDDGHGQCYRMDKGQRPPTVHPCGCTERCRAGNGVDPSRRYSEHDSG